MNEIEIVLRVAKLYTMAVLDKLLAEAGEKNDEDGNVVEAQQYYMGVRDAIEDFAFSMDELIAIARGSSYEEGQI